MAECRYFPECQRLNETGDSWIPCTGGSDGTRCHGYEPMPDVDALAKLADEIWENADLSRELHSEMLKEKRLDMALTFHEYACELREYAGRIRDALGVTDG